MSDDDQQMDFFIQDIKMIGSTALRYSNHVFWPDDCEWWQ